MSAHKPLQRRHSSARVDSSHYVSPLPSILTISKAVPLDLLPFMVFRKRSQPATPQMRSAKPFTDSLSPKNCEKLEDTKGFLKLIRPRSSLESGILGDRLGTKIAARRSPGPGITTVVVKMRKPNRGKNNHEKLKKGLSWLELPYNLEKSPINRKNVRSKSKKYLKSQSNELAVRAKCVWKQGKYSTIRKSVKDSGKMRAQSQFDRCLTSSFDKIDQCTGCSLDTDPAE